MGAKGGIKYDNCAVFWDIENVPIPRQVRPREFADRFRSTVLKPNGLNDEEFYCVCDTVKLAQQKAHAEFFDGLSKAGITVIHIQNCSKNAADEKIIDLMCKYVDKGGSSIVLIAGDVNYVNHLRRFQAKSVKNYLVCPSYKSSSRDLINSAHKCYVVVKKPDGKIYFAPHGARDVSATPSSIKLGPCYVKVDGFPRDYDARPLRLFKQLISATGGKILREINEYPTLWIIYKCSSDAQRAALKINGYLFDNKNNLTAHYIENPPFNMSRNIPHSSSSTLSCPSSPWDDEVRQLKAVNLSEDSSVYVEVVHDFDPQLIEAFLNTILPHTNGKIERSAEKRYYIKFPSEKRAQEFIDNINPLNKKTSHTHISAKLIPTRPTILKRDPPVAKSPQKTEPLDNLDDVVYLGSKQSDLKCISKPEKLYMSVLLDESTEKMTPHLLEVLEQKGVFLIHESSDSMWFKIKHRETGKKVMDRLSRYGYVTFLSERLPEELNCKLRGIRAWTIK